MSKKKILVVDDEKLIVKGIRFSLEQDDMEVDCAYDGEEALQYAKNCEYDLVLGVSERRNRTLLDMVRSMMSLTNLPLSFWGYALETAAFTLNRAPRV